MVEEEKGVPVGAAEQRNLSKKKKKERSPTVVLAASNGNKGGYNCFCDVLIVTRWFEVPLIK